MTYKKINNDACVMVIASKTLELLAVMGLNECENEKMGDFLAHVMLPALVLRTFSCELILKSLVAKTHGTYGNSHKLIDLYRMVDESTKDMIANGVIGKMQKHNTDYGTTAFLADLEVLTDFSMDWRYLYENPRSLNTAFLKHLFNELVKYTLPE